MMANRINISLELHWGHGNQRSERTNKCFNKNIGWKSDCVQRQASIKRHAFEFPLSFPIENIP